MKGKHNKNVQDRDTEAGTMVVAQVKADCHYRKMSELLKLVGKRKWGRAGRKSG